MPSGHLKHKQNLSRRKALGGGSHKSPRKNESRQENKHCRRKQQCLDYDKDDFCFGDYDEDFFVGKCTKSSQPVGFTEIPAECMLCCDTAWPLIKLMKKCKHESACYNCLRQIYVKQAQENVSNYPLECFHPDCNLLVRGDQLQAHALFMSESEMKRHHRFAALSKLYKQPVGGIVHCPFCDHPHPRRVSHDLDEDETKRIKCNSCKEIYLVGDTYVRGTKGDAKNDVYQAVQVIESIKYESNFGYNEGWGRCPSCRLIVNKGDGCFHMTCVCGRHFNWGEARHNAKKEERSFYKWKDR